MTEKFDITKFFQKIDVLDHGYIELFDGMIIQPNLKVVNAARVSHKKSSQEYSQKDAKLVRFLFEHGHFSTYRHSYLSFRIKAPLFVFRQWWKYQIGSSWEAENEIGDSIIISDTSWNENSLRYSEAQTEFYVPTIVRGQSSVNKQGSSSEEIIDIDGVSPQEIIRKASDEAFRTYNRLIYYGVAKEIARLILPANVYSECIWTCSLQSIIHFFKQRLKNDAQYEIREFAWAMYLILDGLLIDLIDFNGANDVENYSWFRDKIKSHHIDV
jgi:thymidylate synthase (FAD)